MMNKSGQGGIADTLTVYFRGGEVMPKGKHIINNKQKRAAQ